MIENNASARLVLTTTASPDEGERLARALVEEQLAACATLVPSVRSIYRWEGKVEDSSETLVLIKTDIEHLTAVEERLHGLHSYQTPEFLVLHVDAGSRAYLGWMQESLRRT